VSFQGGRLERALEQLGQCLALLPAPDRSRGNALSHFAEVLGVAGRADEADAAAREGLAIGRRLGDSWVIGACAWSAMIVAAHRGDLEATRWWIDQVERSPGPWLEVGSGVEFLMEASDLLAANGDEAGARRYYRLAADRIEALGIPDALDQLTVRIESTFGDPIRADELLAAVDDSNFAVQRNRWVRRLLRAQAALRRGDREAARHFVDEGVRELGRLGDLGLLWRTEPRLAATLVDFLPDREGRPDAGWDIALFGVFSVEVDGVDRTPAAGHPSNLVKYLALRGPVPNDEAIEFLWPDATASAGRARLRNLLNRIRDRSGELVVRRGGSLCLADRATVDVTRFEELARAALVSGGTERVGTARRALALHGGDLLVGDVYEDWTTAARERLRRLHLSLVDIVVDHALGLDDLDEALALLDTAIAAEPLDDRRYLLAADALERQGRRQQAVELLARAIEVLTSAGLPISAELGDRGGR
jgi:DNA-binding SARP family transcriptional activator